MGKDLERHAAENERNHATAAMRGHEDHVALILSRSIDDSLVHRVRRGILRCAGNAAAKVKQAPTTPQELLAWCKANPNRLIYARPSNSGPGRTFIMGLPFILGDKNPKDLVNGWDKTWAYLKDLNSCIEYYPSGTTAVMKELGEGSRDMTVTMTGWDLNPRILGIVPKDFKVTPFKGMTWVKDAHYMVIPKGVPPEKIAVVLDLMAFLLTPEAQAYTYDKG
jgi:putative spermidine/putrescine transport system substrate-binding protein